LITLNESSLPVEENTTQIVVPTALIQIVEISKGKASPVPKMPQLPKPANEILVPPPSIP